MGYTKFPLFGIILILLLVMQITESFHCQENEKQALLSFKQSLTDPMRRLSSWVGHDCCKWNGVGCNNLTGNVVKLDLQNPVPDPDGYLEPYNKWCLQATKVDASLQDLKHLSYLDLSWNNFSGIPIPNFFGSFLQLKYLNLSHAQFGGTVPPHLGSLSNLESLDLALPGYDPWELTVDTLQWMSNMSSLQNLDMGNIDLSNEKLTLSRAINSVPSLLELRLSDCRLGEIPHFLSSLNLTRLAVLDLSSNDIQSSIPYSLRNMTSLRALILSDNQFNSSGLLFNDLKNLKHLEILDLGQNNFKRKAIEHSGNISSPSIIDSLVSLRLSFNNIDGPLPGWLNELKKLKYLDLSINSLSGQIPATLGAITSLKEVDLSENKLAGPIPSFLWDLEVIRLSENRLTGEIPTSLGSLPVLRILDLGNNQLNGQIPASIGRLSKLETLKLGFNQLSGIVPKGLGRLSKLTWLDLSYNFLQGDVSEVHFAELSKLEYLDLGMNSISWRVQSDWVSPFQLTYLNLVNCEVGPRFPEWLRTQTVCSVLNMSYAKISDSIPNWFHNFSSKLNHLDLSHNHIYNDFPNQFNVVFPLLPPNIAFLDISHNQISGPLPINISDMYPELFAFHVSNNNIDQTIPVSLCKMQKLQSLDISENKLSGGLPRCWGDLSILEKFDLASNNLSGTIPTPINKQMWITKLRLSNNYFHGDILSALHNCPFLTTIDLGENSFSGTIPAWIGQHLLSLEILRLRSNNLTGDIPPELCNLQSLHIIDLAHNNLSGIIPDCFGNLNSMVSSFYGQYDLDGLSKYGPDTNKLNQMLGGRDQEYKKILPILINMDLSGNNLVGEIPEKLTNLAALIGLNLSENHLVGNIPIKIGKMGSLESLDLSLNHISGVIPQSISLLSKLSHLNLSHNSLSGSIPSGSQLQTLNDASIYEGNLELCGPPLKKKCPSNELPQGLTDVDGNGDEKGYFSMKWFYIGVISGSVVGFWGVYCVLLLKKTWRYAYFRFVDDIIERLLLAIELIMIKLKRKFN